MAMEKKLTFVGSSTEIAAWSNDSIWKSDQPDRCNALYKEIQTAFVFCLHLRQCGIQYHCTVCCPVRKCRVHCWSTATVCVKIAESKLDTLCVIFLMQKFLHCKKCFLVAQFMAVTFIGSKLGQDEFRVEKVTWLEKTGTAYWNYFVLVPGQRQESMGPLM